MVYIQSNIARNNNKQEKTTTMKDTIKTMEFKTKTMKEKAKRKQSHSQNRAIEKRVL